MALPNKGITTYIVARALGTSTRDVGRLCTHNNINKWAKHKPVNLASVVPDRNSNWWKGDNRRCGLVYQILSTFEQVRAEYSNPLNWSYEKVDPSYPKRLADFGGYNHKATAPVMRTVPPTSPDNAQGGIIAFTLQAKFEPSPDELSLSDFDDLKDSYMGIALYRRGSFFKAATSESTIGQGGIDVMFDSGGFYADQYEAIPFFATQNKIVEGQTLPSNHYITLPNASIMTFKVEEASSVVKPTLRIVAILVEGEEFIGQKDVDVTISVLKLGKAEETLFSPVVVDLYINGGIVSGKTINTWQVNMSDPSTRTLKVRFEGVNFHANDEGKVEVALSKKYNYSTNVVKENFQQQ